MQDGATPLVMAARLAVEGMVEDLINADADINLCDEYGRIKWDLNIIFWRKERERGGGGGGFYLQMIIFVGDSLRLTSNFKKNRIGLVNYEKKI